MELGISPIISSGMVFQVFNIWNIRLFSAFLMLTSSQLLGGTHIIDVNLDLKSDRELYQTAQKCKKSDIFYIR